MGGSERRSGSTFGIADGDARPCCSVVGAEYRYYPLAVLGSRIAVLGRVRRGAIGADSRCCGSSVRASSRLARGAGPVGAGTTAGLAFG